ncbi:hypothetical protein XH88_06550 [Bradyrhizobium sp. CCBAU 51627]|nr:hypothetical protein [Bradyrhizobium sp. CCBAU 51627]
MLRDFQYYFWDGSVTSVLSLFAAFLSVAAAAYSTLLLRKMTLRSHGLENEFEAEVGAWMHDARINYAKEQSGNSDKKSRKSPTRPSPTS